MYYAPLRSTPLDACAEGPGSSRLTEPVSHLCVPEDAVIFYGLYGEYTAVLAEQSVVDHSRI